jgi:hypothetical protein
MEVEKTTWHVMRDMMITEYTYVAWLYTADRNDKTYPKQN